MKIAVDAMGGDNAPESVVLGIVQAQTDYPDMEFILYGDETKIKPYLPDTVKNIEIVHTTEKIMSEDEPVKAVRKKKDASMVLAAQAVKNGDADAMLSAGNTGALLVAGLFVVGRLKGIDRPALMPTLPVLGSDKGFNFLDVGANADARPNHLYQQAILGSYYAKNVRGIENPRIGLLNNGTEANKGNELTKEAHALLEKAAGMNFIGNVEARDLLDGVADVVVTDGFTGNAVLKTIEGTAMSVMKLIKGAIMDSGVKGKLGGLLLKNSLSGLKTQMDYSQYGGAVLIGLAAPVVKTHGAANPDAFVVCVKQLHEMLSSHMIEEMKEYFDTHQILENSEEDTKGE